MNKKQRREYNLKLLASLRDSDANREHIFGRAQQRHRVMELLTRFIKRKKADRAKAETNLEIYLDDWAFHHGTTITKENIGEAVADLVDRVAKQKLAKQRLEAEEPDDDDGMKDFPL